MTERKQNSEKLKRFALEQGASLFGVADVTSARDEFLLKKEIRAKFDWGISLADLRCLRQGRLCILPYLYH